MNNEEQQANLSGRINGENMEAAPPEPSFEADLQGLQKPQSNKSKTKIVLGIVIGLIIAIVAGVFAALAAGLWNPVWNPFQSSPEEIFAEALQNMANLETVHTKLIYNIDLDAEEGFSGNMIIESDSNATDLDNPKSQSVIDMSISAEGMEMFFNAEARSLDEVLYFKVGTIPIPLVLVLSQVGMDASEWTDKWFMFDSKELGMTFIKILSAEERAQMQEEIQKLLLEYPLASIVEELAGEKIDGQNTYHYLLSLEKENSKKFLVGMIEIVSRYYEMDYLTDVSEEDRQEMLDGIDELFKVTGGIDFEMWIGRKDKLVHRVAGQKTFDLSEIEEARGEEGILSLDFSISFSKFDEPVEILAPENAESIIQMMMPFIQMFMGQGFDGPSQGLDLFGLNSASAKAKDARIQSSINQLRTQAELIWVDNQDGYKSLCSYGRININHPDKASQLKSPEDDVIDQGSYITCYAEKDKYCVSARLLENQEFFCVDSTGIAISVPGTIDPCTYTAKCNF